MKREKQERVLLHMRDKAIEQLVFTKVGSGEPHSLSDSTQDRIQIRLLKLSCKTMFASRK